VEVEPVVEVDATKPEEAGDDPDDDWVIQYYNFLKIILLLNVINYFNFSVLVWINFSLLSKIIFIDCFYIFNKSCFNFNIL
jgi:hypothetical protein